MLIFEFIIILYPWWVYLCKNLSRGVKKLLINFNQIAHGWLLGQGSKSIIEILGFSPITND